MENQYQICLGADISNQSIDISLLEKDSDKIIYSKTIANKSKNIKSLIDTLVKKYGNFFAVMEATGNYHRKFVAELIAAKLPFAVINPLIAKRYAQMKMLRTKTDKIDARTLALFAFEQKPKAFIIPSKEQVKVRDLITVQNHLVKQKTQNKNLLHSQRVLPEPDQQVIKSIKMIISAIDIQLKKIERKIDEILSKNFSELYNRTISIKGIGKKTSQAVIAYLGNLENFNSYKQVSAFIGINPKIENSGSSLNKRKGLGKQGNKLLRTLFYMSALGAIKSNRKCKQLYIRLLQKGKAKMSALIAVANKLIKQLFAIVKNNRTYSDDYVRPMYA